MYPVKLKPYISSTIWGGRRLIDEYGVETDKENAAEAWVLSCHPRGCGVIENGEFKGRTLKSVYEEDRSICGKNAERFKEFPILIKFIDARDNLSIQVHPDEDYARRVENGAGKTECWYILDADDGAELILGFKKEISKATFENSIKDNTLLDHVSKVKVKKGDFFFIEAGTLHAICKGVLLVEVQQNSDTTYRIYDYNRKSADGKPRELHISKAVDVTQTLPYKMRKIDECKAKELNTEQKKLLTSCDLFNVSRVKSDSEYASKADENSFVSLLFLDGEGVFEGGGESFSVKKGESVFVPAGTGNFKVIGKTEILETRI
ncbi:MAG: class I mannose-6-phosphate isomerase [Clostridiales bacterium]|nr:class I mannose-6-phosphate isomerase [Clostridiales bacterium]